MRIVLQKSRDILNIIAFLTVFRFSFVYSRRITHIVMLGRSICYFDGQKENILNTPELPQYDYVDSAGDFSLSAESVFLFPGKIDDVSAVEQEGPSTRDSCIIDEHTGF